MPFEIRIAEIDVECMNPNCGWFGEKRVVAQHLLDMGGKLFSVPGQFLCSCGDIARQNNVLIKRTPIIPEEEMVPDLDPSPDEQPGSDPPVGKNGKPLDIPMEASLNLKTKAVTKGGGKMPSWW